MKVTVLGFILLITLVNIVESQLNHINFNTATPILDPTAHQIMFHHIGDFATEVQHINLVIPVEIDPILKSLVEFPEKVREQVKKNNYNGVNLNIAHQNEVRLNNTRIKIESLLTPLKTTHSIKKRQAGLILAGGFGALITGGFGLADLSKANSLRNEVNKIDEVDNQLLMFADEEDKEIHHLQQTVGNITKIMIAWNHNHPSILQSRLQKENHEAERCYNLLLNTVEAAQNSRLSHSLLKKEQLVNLYDKVMKTGKKKGFDVQATQPMDLFKMDTSYYVTQNNTLVLIVHVPIVKKDHLLPLYQFIPFPISQSFGYNTAMTPFLGDRDLIAAKWVKKEVRYKVLSHTDLLLCNKIGMTYLCPGRNSLQTNLESTCIGSLFGQNLDGVLKNCPFEITEHHEHVYALSDDEYLVSSRESYRTSVDCPEHSYEVNIGPISQLKIEGGCMVKLQRHTLRPDKNSQTTPEVIRVQWNWQQEQLFPNMDAQDVINVIDKLKSDGTKVLTAKDIQKWQFDSDNNPITPQMHSMAILASIAACIILPFLLCICFRCECYRWDSCAIKRRQRALPSSTATSHNQATIVTENNPIIKKNKKKNDKKKDQKK